MLNINIENKVRQSFASQSFMTLLNAKLLVVNKGYIEINLPYSDKQLQQNGFTHGAAIAAIADTACGYAAISLADLEIDMLTVEYKINFLRPAIGYYFTAIAKIIKDGKRIKVATCEVINDKGDFIAVMNATIITASN